MKTFIAALMTLGIGLNALPLSAASLDEEIKVLQQQWAEVKYQTSKDQQDAAFERLTQQSESTVSHYSDRAEPLIWQAIIVSSHAGATGGFGALSKVKKARDLLLAAEHINPTALDGSIYTSLGSLYYQVPGWPLGFGDDEKAEEYLKRALELNPDGIDPNYFYGDFLRDQGRYQEAATYLERALKAPDRPDRPIADQGRRAEAEQALQSVMAELKD